MWRGRELRNDPSLPVAKMRNDPSSHPTRANLSGTVMRKVKRDARTLRAKAVASLRYGLSSFNGYSDEGRQTAVLLHLQHAGEMLIKAALVQGNLKVFDRKQGTSLGMEKCLNLAASSEPCKLAANERGALRAIDALRDAEQHWMITVSENILYLHVRALVTIFDDVLKRAFGEGLARYLPARVLPISTRAPTELHLLIDDEFSQILDLLKPGRRHRDEARGRIRTLLAMEAHATDDEVRISEADIDRIEKAVKNAKAWRDIFPRLSDVKTEVSGAGGDALDLRVHFTKGQGAPVSYTSDASEAAAIREVDLQNRFFYGGKELADKIGVHLHMAAVMKRYLKIDEDANCMHLFRFGGSKHIRYSENALAKLRELKEKEDLKALWANRKNI